MNDRLWVVFSRYAGTKKWNIHCACSGFEHAFGALNIASRNSLNTGAKYKMVQYMPVPETNKPLLRKVVAKARTIAKAKAKAKR